MFIFSSLSLSKIFFSLLTGTCSSFVIMRKMEEILFVDFYLAKFDQDTTGCNFAEDL